MTTIAVNGTSIQAAVDKAVAGDTLAMTAGSYAGFKASKRLNYRGDGVVIEGPGNTVELTAGAAGSTMVGAMTIRGSTGENAAALLLRADDFTADGVTFEEAANGFGVRAFADRTHLQRNTFRKLGCAVEFNTKAAGSIVEDFTLAQMDRMVTIDWGGTGFNFYATAGPTIIRRGTMIGCRALSSRYGYDGGAFATYAGSKGVTIEDVEVRDSLNVYEDGHTDVQPDNANWTWRRVKVYGDPAKVTDQWWITPKDRSCMGFLIRATQNVLVEDCELVNLDGWYFMFDHSSRHAGLVKAVNVRNNRLVHKDGDNRAYIVLAGITPSEITVNNRVQRAPGLRYTAHNEVLKANTNDLAAFKKWGVLVGAGETWGPLETPLETAIRERDEARAALADCQAGI